MSQRKNRTISISQYSASAGRFRENNSRSLLRFGPIVTQGTVFLSVGRVQRTLLIHLQGTTIGYQLLWRPNSGVSKSCEKINEPQDRQGPRSLIVIGGERTPRTISGIQSACRFRHTERLGWTTSRTFKKLGQSMKPRLESHRNSFISQIPTLYYTYIV